MSEHPVARLSLLLPWAILACGVPVILWWAFESVPVTVNYVAPMFLSRPALNRADAATVYVSEVKGGTVVYRYVSYCVSRPFDATSTRVWVGEAITWPAPNLPTALSRVPGCYEANFAVLTPTSSPTRTFSYTQELVIPMSPIRTARVQYSPIPLTILDSKQ